MTAGQTGWRVADGTSPQPEDAPAPEVHPDPDPSLIQEEAPDADCVAALEEKKTRVRTRTHGLRSGGGKLSHGMVISHIRTREMLEMAWQGFGFFNVKTAGARKQCNEAEMT